MSGLGPETGRNAFKAGTAVTFPIVLGPTEAGIITMSPPPEGLGCAPRAGLRGRGLWGGVDGGRGCCSDTFNGEREGLRGRGFLGGLIFWGDATDLGVLGELGGLLIGGGGRGPLMLLRDGDGAGRRGRTILTG